MAPAFLEVQRLFSVSVTVKAVERCPASVVPYIASLTRLVSTVSLVDTSASCGTASARREPGREVEAKIEKRLPTDVDTRFATVRVGREPGRVSFHPNLMYQPHLIVIRRP